MVTQRPQAANVDTASKRGLRALVASNAISTLGDGAFVAAAPLAAAAITRNPAAIALVAAAETLPWVVVSPIAGVFVDRWQRRRTMIVADLLRAFGVAALAAMIVFGVASVPVIAVCAFLIVTGIVFHSAAAEIVIADLTKRDEHALNAVNGQIQSTTTLGRQLLGPPLGSLVWAWRPWLPFAFDAVSFVGSAVLLWLVPKGDLPARTNGTVWQQMKDGAQFLMRHRELRLLAVLTGAANLSVNAGLATLVLFATDPHGLAITGAAYGLLLAAMSLGGLTGGLVAPRLLKAVGYGRAFTISLLVEAASWVAIALGENRYLAGAGLAIIGFTLTTKSVIIVGTRQKNVPSDLLGRVISAYRVVGNGTAPIGALVGGLVAAAWGLRTAMLFAALVLVPLALVSSRVFRRPTSQLPTAS